MRQKGEVIGVREDFFEGEADGGCVEGLLGGGGVAEDGKGDVVGGVVVLVSQVLEDADFAEALQHAEDLATLGQISGTGHDPQVNGARRQQLRCAASGGHGGVRCRCRCRYADVEM